MNYRCLENYLPHDSINKELQFATSVAMFGLKLRQSKYFPENISWDTIKNIAVNSLDKSNFLETEYIELVDKCNFIYDARKKHKKNRKKHR